jgi:hypothetical protein
MYPTPCGETREAASRPAIRPAAPSIVPELR